MKPKFIGVLAIALGGLLGVGAFFVGGWFAIFASASLSLPPIQPHVAEVRGVVLDEVTRRPVPDAGITIASSLAYGEDPPASYGKTQSNERGEFRVRMTVGGTTQFNAKKRGYLYAGACRNPLAPVEIFMRSIPSDSGQTVGHSGVFPAVHGSEPIRLALERGVLRPDEEGEDIRASLAAGGGLTIVAGPGRSIVWRPSEPSPSGWNYAPLNSCEAPADGYGEMVLIPANAPRGLCFVRRDDGPEFGAFSIDPGAFYEGGQPEASYYGVLNRGGGRGLCRDEMCGWTLN